MRERCADVLDLEHIDEELRRLADAVGDHRAVLAHHRDARRRRRHDVLRIAEHPLEAPGQRRALVRVARVDVHLAAAGLLLGEHDLEPSRSSSSTTARPVRGEERVVEARDEESCPHRRGA